MTPNRFRRLLPIVLVAALALVGACGSSKSDSGAGKKAGVTAVDIKDFTFKPAGITVKAGTEVTWTNSDTFAHTVTAEDKSFDSKNIDAKGTFTQKFEKPGTYKYLCSIHNSMTGTVTVN